MAKKKSKGFIVPSINFITMQKEEASKKAPQISTLANAGASVSVAVSEESGFSDPPLVKGTSKASEVSKAPEVSKVPEDSESPESPKKPAPLKARSNGRRNSALSLSSLKRKKEEEELLRKQDSRKKSENLPMEAFSQEDFDWVWKEYIASLHRSGEKILASILMADKPVIKDDKIHLCYPNQLMKTELLRVRPKVLKHLRKKLSNHAVDFVVEVKAENAKRFAYTPQEKYELLKEKNKDISLLRKTFNLEL